MAKKPKWKIKFNQEAFEEIRHLPGVIALEKEIAESVANEASENGRVDGYIVTELVLEDPRGAVSVMATEHAHKHNRKNHTLIKALGGHAL